MTGGAPNSRLQHPLLPSPLDTARDFIARGWAPIPIQVFQKGPRFEGWPHLRVTQDNVAQYFNAAPGNVGVLLGEPSGNVVDIDLDCAEAVELAPEYLEPTLTFGRESKRRSHWLYMAGGLVTEQFESPAALDPDGKSKTLVEIRSTGSQTVFPGSTHPSGELVSFENTGTPVAVDATDLRYRVRRLAAAALLRRSGWEVDDVRVAISDPLARLPGRGAAAEAALNILGLNNGAAAAGSSEPPQSGESASQFQAAVDRYNVDHARTYPKSGGQCPGCEHRDCFGQLAENQARWCCFSASHGAEHGGIHGDKVWHGDALDLDAVEGGCTRAQLLQRDGYLDVDATIVLDAFKEKIRADADGAFVGALEEREVLWAVRGVQRDAAGYELLKHELNKAGLTLKQVAALEKAAKGLKRPKPKIQAAPSSAAPQSVAGAQALATRPPRPTIEVYDREFRDVEAEATRALVLANVPPSLFCRGGAIVDVVVRDGLPQLVDHTQHTIVRVLSAAANWLETKVPAEEWKEPSITAVFPDRTVAQSLLGRPPAELPEIEGVVTTPYLGCDGAIVSAPGYSASNKLYLHPDPRLVVPPVSSIPTPAEVAAAVALFFDHVYFDFPFVHAGDRAHQLAFTLQPFLRCIDGPTPMFLVEAPEAATGKGLLGDTVATIATGAAMQWRALPPQEEERLKAIFSALRAGTPFVAWDNAKGLVEGPALESALTSRYVSSRVLGAHVEGVAKNRAVWLMTANNVELSRDLIRRSVRIRIDAKSDKPEEGRSFKHPELLTWVTAHRGQLVHAALTLIQNWVAMGRPTVGVRRRASFESWSDTVGGILAAAGVTGFLDSATLMDKADLKRDEGAAFVEAWHQTWPNHPDCTAKELLDVICAKPVSVGGKMEPPKEPEHLPSVLGSGQAGSRVVRLGKWLHRNLNRVFGDYVIVAGTADSHAGVGRYKLVPRPMPVGSGSSGNDDAGKDAGGGGGHAGGGDEPPASPEPSELEQ